MEEKMEIPIYVGTMGWSYADWNGIFYPNETAARDAIALYARAFQAVEIDSTFYGTPREATVKHWKTSTPNSFVFCPKVPRAITHDAGLIDVLEPLREFTRTMRLLGAKLGPMLLQMPPDFTRAELPALRDLLPVLAELQDPAVRFAMEFRHRSLLGEDVSELLRQHNVALVSADYAPMPKRFDPTADFAYLRLIGGTALFRITARRRQTRRPTSKSGPGPFAPTKTNFAPPTFSATMTTKATPRIPAINSSAWSGRKRRSARRKRRAVFSESRR